MEVPSPTMKEGVISLIKYNEQLKVTERGTDIDRRMRGIDAGSHKSDGQIGEQRGGSTCRVQETVKDKTDNIIIETADPHLLEEADFQKIHEITQDMWARGLGEFLECKNCSHIASKFDIFGSGNYGITIDQYKKSVKKILKDMKEEDKKNIFTCPHCTGSMESIYGDEYLQDIKSRLLDTESYLTLCRFRGEIVGYSDFFVAPPREAYERDWKRHYDPIGFSEIENRICATLGYLPEKMICFTAMGLLEEYSNFFTIYSLLNKSFQFAPKSIYQLPGGTELNKNSGLYGIYAIMGSQSLNICEDPSLNKKLVHTQKEYMSDLVVFPNPVEKFIENFSMGIRQFLRTYGSGLKFY